jgi:hypothetical protein
MDEKDCNLCTTTVKESLHTLDIYFKLSASNSQL